MVTPPKIGPSLDWPERPVISVVAGGLSVAAWVGHVLRPNVSASESDAPLLSHRQKRLRCRDDCIFIIQLSPWGSVGDYDIRAGPLRSARLIRPAPRQITELIRNRFLDALKLIRNRLLDALKKLLAEFN